MLKSLKASGFSLIELMIVLVIMAILISFAIPSYQHYLRHARRRQAEQQLYQIALDFEAYYHKHLSYLNVTLPRAIDNQYYRFKINLLNQYNFTVVAIPISSQQHDRCGILSINQWQQKQPDQNACWD